MDIELPADCGNSPRSAIVGELVGYWAAGDIDGLRAWCADDLVWTVIGDATYRMPDMATGWPPVRPDRVTVISVVTHGRLAACDGYWESNGGRVDFSHFFRFAGAAKTAKLARVRTYLVGVDRPPPFAWAGTRLAAG